MSTQIGASVASVVRRLALGQLIDDLRSEAGLSQRKLAERMGRRSR